MRHATTALLLVLAAAAVSAAPPTVTVPPEVKGDVAAFVVVRATVEGGKGVKFVPLDSGLSVFPSGLLADPNVTVVVSGKAGRFRILCYSGNADGPSEPAVTTVVIGPPTPMPPPVVDPPPVTPTDVFYFAVVRPDQNTVEFEKLMRLPAWNEVREKGHQVRDFPLSELPQGVERPATLPAVVVLKRNADGKTWTPTKTVPMPTTDDAIRGILK